MADRPPTGVPSNVFLSRLSVKPRRPTSAEQGAPNQGYNLGRRRACRANGHAEHGDDRRGGNAGAGHLVLGTSTSEISVVRG